jgi:hypothetical protein
VPGYDSPRKPGRETGDPADPPWRGSAAGKGPVRGYPPLPGQPPPMYPPGQFAAWNRRGQGQATQSAASGQAGQGRPADPVAGAARAGYYGRDGEEHAEPGYSTLAISDPAADVTSTQTWQAVGDGRATGMWSAPSRPGEARPGARAAGPGPGTGQLHPDADGLSGQPGDANGRHGRPGGQLAPADDHQDPRGARPDGGTATDRTAGSDWTDRAAADDRAAPDGRAARPSGAGTSRAPGTARAPGTSRAAGTGRARSGRSTASRRGKHPVSVKLAVTGALVIAVIAGVAVYLAGTRATAQHTAAPARKAAPKLAVPTPTPTATLGPYGYIGSRHQDPQPLTISQLYPPSFRAGGVSYVKTKSKLSSDCVDAVNGAGIQGAVSSAACTQAARATYLASKTGMMGTIGVLNLKTAHDASVAAHATGATNFIAQLAGHKAPTSKIGHGAGIEEALAKGHYLILIWAELTSLKTPHKAAQRAGLEQFMTQLLDGTANVSLTNRMINGSPSPAPGA